MYKRFQSQKQQSERLQNIVQWNCRKDIQIVI